MIIFGFIIRNQSFDICPLEWHPLFYDILKDDVDLSDFQIQTISKLKKLITYGPSQAQFCVISKKLLIQTNSR